ncbi:MAG: hypothetical protein R3359_11485, partial [Marinirhabdus sp.]|nr:hypothetical protein [Marinirhabdus sp.]
SDHVTRVVREDPVRRGLLYAGTDFGVFISLNDGATWQAFQQNLPKTPITDIKIFRGDLILSTMGRGFWILDDITPLRQDSFNTSATNAVLFEPDTTIRYRYPMASTGAYPQYKRTSVTIDYFLPMEVSEGIKLSILDADNDVIATVVSDSTQLKTTVTEVENMDLSTVFRFVDEKLSTDKGFNRFEWNLRHKGVWDKEEKNSYQYGPLALPGKYTARLTVNGKTLEQPFEIVADPRVTEQGVTQEVLQEQFEFQNKVIDLLSEAKKFQADLEQQIEIKTETNASTETLENTLKKLKNEEGAYPQQMLISQIGYLYYMVSSADQRPGGEAEKRYESLVSQLEALKQNVDL